jgi:hypothetical protein
MACYLFLLTLKIWVEMSLRNIASGYVVPLLLLQWLFQQLVGSCRLGLAGIARMLLLLPMFAARVVLAGLSLMLLLLSFVAHSHLLPALSTDRFLFLPAMVVGLALLVV